MIRLLGAITGSALALAALLVFIGIPQFKVEPDESDHAVLTLPLPTEAVDVLTPESSSPQVTETPATIEDIPVDDVAVADTAITTTPAESAEEIFTSEAAFDDPFADAIADPMADQQWYAFWSPFRSELAANGFISQLQRVTGLDYRVVKIKPGVYEVAFAYIDDTDISLNLSQISAATGLDMPES